MKKLLILILALAMVLSLGACASTPAGNNSTPAASNPTDSKPSEPAPTEPEPTEPKEPAIYNGLTASQLDAIPGAKADNFETVMNTTWNFGWDGDGTLEYNATKVDFTGFAAEDSLVWRLGTASETVVYQNAGWGVGLWTMGEGSNSFMYAKTDVPEHVTQFRIWAVTLGSEHWSGSGAFRAVALYKDESGEYVSHILTPNADYFGTMLEADKEKVTFTDDGWFQFKDNGNLWGLPGFGGDGMIIYDCAELVGKEDVIIFVETMGLGNVLGDEYTEAAEGVAAGAVMPEMVIIKRVMFLAG